MQRLTGARVMLREFRQEDLSGIRSWVNDYDTVRCLGAGYAKPQSWEQTESYLMSLLNGEAGGVHLAVADRETKRYLGQCGLMMIDHTARRAELAVVLAPDSANRGYGREAIALMLEYAFMQLNLNRVFLQVHADNARAIHVYEKCGFKREGCLRAHFYRDGRYIDAVQMGILRGEWESAREDAESGAASR